MSFTSKGISTRIQYRKCYDDYEHSLPLVRFASVQQGMKYVNGGAGAHLPNSEGDQKTGDNT